jgi:pimeloyl-ACP methyl ester carboxylesterase
MQPYDEWSPEECSKKVRRDALLEENIVEQYIDSINENGQTFSLYYFVKDLTFENSEKPTVLFAAGGPGQMILASSGENFVDLLGYRVVYFHLRGAGFSQLPKDMSFDRYLRTDYVVKDIEAIRRDLLGNSKWLAIIGHSYGAVVAQCYAHQFPDSVEKIVLSAPITPVCALNGKQLAREDSVEPKFLESLRRIYERDDFAFLDNIPVADDMGPLKKYIVSRVEYIVKEIDRSHWNVQFVSEEYTRLEPDLRKRGLDLGAPFFIAVRKLRLCGWLPLDVPLARGGDIEVDTAQLESGLIIADAVLKKLNTPIDLTVELKRQKTKANGRKKKELKIVLGALKFANRSIAIKNSQNTARPYYVISLYDGLNEKFQRELERYSDVKKAIQSIGGRDGYNPSLEKAAIELRDPPTPWDPAKRQHSHSTLILKGGADPLNELGEAKYYFDHGSTGERALIEFPGVGHSMALPQPLLNSGAGINEIAIQRNGKTNMESLGTREGLIHAFLAMTYPEFKKAKILTEIKSAFEDALHGFKKSRPRPKKPGMPSKLEQERLIIEFWPR